jgi:hypothetical protein
VLGLDIPGGVMDLHWSFAGAAPAN